MADVFDTVTDLLDRRQWAACAEQAALALADREWPQDQKAFLLLARSTSLRRLQFFVEALEPARLATYLAEDLPDQDLLGRALSNLAYIQHKIQGMEASAVETQRRFLSLFPTYRSLRDQLLAAMLNLGVYLRAAGMYQEAFDQLKSTYETAMKRGNRQVAQLSRTYAVWEALRLEDVAEAEALIEAGEQADQKEPHLRAHHMLDLAQLSMLRKKPAEAIGYVIAAMPDIEQIETTDPHLLPLALEILARAAEQVDDSELAMVAAVLAKEKAESVDRHDIAAEAADLARSIALQNPCVVEKVTRSLDGVKP